MATVPRQMLQQVPSAPGGIDITSAARQFFAAALVPIASGQVTLVGGTASVAIPTAGTSSRPYLNRLTAGGTVGHLSASCVTGTLTITSTSATETSVITYFVVNP
jgi:hypothetical protein